MTQEAPAGDYLLERAQFIPRAVGEVFDFFSRAENLEALTPPFLNFKITTPAPIRMEEGALIDYQLRLFGVPFGWRTRIESWDPGRGFVDTQLEGPYRLWHHTHRFFAVDGGTLMVDRVLYSLPLGPLGWMAHAVSVRRTLDRIFAYRRDRTAGLLAPAAEASSRSEAAPPARLDVTAAAR
jgi:ligand-binding SRPBCC domain-containing protein